MATSITNSSPASSALLGQRQLQQAQRTVDQAVQRARSLQAEAAQAQSEADRAQTDARAVRADARQADSNVDTARRGLNALKAEQAPQAKITSNPPDIGGQRAKAASETQAASKPVPVVNVFGQQTGTVINVTA